MIYLGDDPIGMSTFGMCNELTKHEKKTVSFPNASNSNNWADGAIVPVSFEPKIIIFYGGDSTISGNIYRGCFAIDISSYHVYVGAGRYKNAATGNNSIGGFEYSLTGTGAAYFKYENGNFYAKRLSANGYWSNTDTYTFEFYG